MPQQAKTPVDSLIHARWIIPVEPAGAVLNHHTLVIKDNAIFDILHTDLARQRYRSRKIYELDHHVLIPGLINAHGHAAMTLFRGLADDLPLMTWLNNHIWPAEQRWVSEDFVSVGTELAIAEMLLSGTTCFSDMYFFPNRVARAAHKHKIRAHIMAPVIEFPSAWANDANNYIHKALELYDDYKNHELINIGFGPHATYTVSDEALQRVRVLADELDSTIQIHLHETAQEVSDAANQTGRRPLLRLDELDFLSPRVQCVHMTQVSDKDLELLKHNDCKVIHCPKSNLKLASGFCPVSQLLNEGIEVALGTDGAASNNELDLFSEMQMAALLAKGISGDASSLNAHQTLRMATLSGARVLGIDAVTGSLGKGKSADIVAVDLSRVTQQPVYDPSSHLVYTANGHNVSHVWVDSQLLVENAELKTINMDTLQGKVRVWRAKISAAENQQNMMF